MSKCKIYNMRLNTTTKILIVTNDCNFTEQFQINHNMIHSVTNTIDLGTTLDNKI